MEHLFFFSGSVTSFFLLLLISKRNKAFYDWFLIAWFVVIWFHILVFYYSSKNQYSVLLEISSAAVFLNGPLLWYYTWFLFHRDAGFKWKQGLHLLPFFLNLVLILPYLLQNSLAPFSELSRMLLTWAKLGSILVYCLMAVMQINQNMRMVEQFFSNTENHHVKWLKMALNLVLTIWFIGIISQLVFHSNFFGLDPMHEDIAINFAVSVLIIYMGYYGFKQAPVFVGNFPLPVSEEKENRLLADPKRYQKSSMSPEEVKHYANLLENMMTSEKCFLDPDLRLSSLDIKLGLSTNQLSQIINQYYEKNFYEFVNSFRVEEVIRRFNRGEIKHSTLLGIGLEAGFNSKASFNRCFKKQTGKTPSEYLQSHSSLI